MATARCTQEFRRGRGRGYVVRKIHLLAGIPDLEHSTKLPATATNLAPIYWPKNAVCQLGETYGVTTKIMGRKHAETAQVTEQPRTTASRHGSSVASHAARTRLSTL